MILFYQGSLFDLLVLAWARGQFCHWAWKKLHVAAMSFVLSFDSGFAIKETFVEVCECWAKCGLCKSNLQRWLPSFFRWISDPSLKQRASDLFRGVKMIVFLTFWQALLLPGTSTNRKPPRFGLFSAMLAFPTRPLAPLPGSTSKWEELPWCFSSFCSLASKNTFKNMLPSCGCLFFGFWHCWIWENIGIWTGMDWDVPLCTMRTAKTSTFLIETLPLLQPSVFQEQTKHPMIFFEHRRTSSSPLRWSSLAFWWIWHSHGWIPQFWKPSLSLQVCEKPPGKKAIQNIWGVTKSFLNHKKFCWLLESHEFCIFPTKIHFFVSQERVQFSSRNYDFTARWVFSYDFPSFSLRCFFSVVSCRPNRPDWPRWFEGQRPNENSSWTKTLSEWWNSIGKIEWIK